MQKVWAGLDGTGNIRQVWYQDPAVFKIAFGGRIVPLTVPSGIAGNLVGMKVIGDRLAGPAVRP